MLSFSVALSALRTRCALCGTDDDYELPLMLCKHPVNPS